MINISMLIFLSLSFFQGISWGFLFHAIECSDLCPTPNINNPDDPYQITFEYNVKIFVGRVWKELGKYGTEEFPDVKIKIISDADQDLKFSTTSGSDGRFQICNVPDGDFSLTAEAEGYRKAIGHVTISNKASTTAQVVFPMFSKSSNIDHILNERALIRHDYYTWEDGGKFRGFSMLQKHYRTVEIDKIMIINKPKGRIYFEHAQIIGRPPIQDKTPLPGVVIELRGPDYANKILKSTTDSKGRFEFPMLDEGEYRFLTTFEGFLSKTGIIKFTSNASEANELIIFIPPE